MINDLDVILSEGESYTVEFKESPDKSLPSEVCAFANASGGRIFIGVDDRGRVVGTDVSNAARSRVQDTINRIEPNLKVDIEVLDNILLLIIPEGTHKPYSCSKGFYLRSGPNSQKLERDSIIEFFQNEGRVRYDEIVREDLPVTERFNEAAYKRYVKLSKISEVLDREAILKNLNCAGLINGRFCFTNAGALFFRVNDEDVMFRHAGIVCALYKGTDKAYILDAKEFNGDVVSNVDDAMVFLKKHLRISYKIKSLQRENILELPEDALREAIVNAVSHRDYFEKGARVMVEIYDDRVDIVNPGGVCKGITIKNFGTVSITRNSVLASMLYRINYIEQMGTGIMRMKNATREAKVAEPEFEFSNFFKVTFRRNAIVQKAVSSDAQATPKRRPSDAQATVSDTQATPSDAQAAPKRLQATPKRRQATASDAQAAPKRLQATPKRRPSDTQATPSDRKSTIITYLEARKKATAPDIAALLGVTNGWARTILRQMTSDGTIEKVGDNRYAYYVMKGQ